jgi:hypothetical protein
VEDFIKQCPICQQAKHTNTLPAGLLQPLPILEGAWKDLSMDFIEGLPKSEGFSIILVMVDRFTKMPILCLSNTLLQLRWWQEQFLTM